MHPMLATRSCRSTREWGWGCYCLRDSAATTGTWCWSIVYCTTRWRFSGQSKTQNPNLLYIRLTQNPKIINWVDGHNLGQPIVTHLHLECFRELCGKANENTSPHFQQFRNYAVLLSLRESLKMQSGSDCFRFLFRGKRSSGFMPTEVQWILGTTVPRHSSPSSFWWAKPIMLLVEESPVFSKSQVNQHLKQGKAFRSTS